MIVITNLIILVVMAILGVIIIFVVVVGVVVVFKAIVVAGFEVRAILVVIMACFTLRQFNIIC